MILNYLNNKMYVAEHFLKMLQNNLRNSEISHFGYFEHRINSFKISFKDCKYSFRLHEKNETKIDVIQNNEIIFSMTVQKDYFKKMSDDKVDSISELFYVYSQMIKDSKIVDSLYTQISRKEKLEKLNEEKTN